MSGRYSDTLSQRAEVSFNPTLRMTKDQLLKLPLWQYTGEQFLELLDSHFVKTSAATESVTSDENVATTAKRWLVYGIKGLCELLQCSKATAHRIKNSGIIKDAITQSGRKIVIDAQKALDLIQEHKKGGEQWTE